MKKGKKEKKKVNFDGRLYVFFQFFPLFINVVDANDADAYFFVNFFLFFRSLWQGTSSEVVIVID